MARPIYETYDPYDAPYGMIQQAVPEAMRLFRTDIAPFIATFRAEIVTKPLVGEERATRASPRP
jgi:hypothetical protein